MIGSQAERKLIDDAVDEALWGKSEAVVDIELCRSNNIDFSPATDSRLTRAFTSCLLPTAE